MQQHISASLVNIFESFSTCILNFYPGPGHSSVPSWEMTFCASVCCVPWEKICAAKFSMPGYKTIADWDDLGALEAFNNAKARYWAEINGLPSDLPLPDPEMFIDKVDQNPYIDPELVVDLEKLPPPPRESNDYEDLSYETFLNATLPVVAQGWGDAEVETPVPATGGDSSGNLWKRGGTNASGGQHLDQRNGRRGRLNGRNRNGYCSAFARSPAVMKQWKPKPSCATNGQRSAEGSWRWGYRD